MACGAVGAAVVSLAWGYGAVAIGFVVLAAAPFAIERTPAPWRLRGARLGNYAVAIALAWILSDLWHPLGRGEGAIANFVFVVLCVGGLLGFFSLFRMSYGHTLQWCLAHKGVYLSMPVVLVIIGLSVWRGFGWVFAPVPAVAEAVGIGDERVRQSSFWHWGMHTFPGLGTEFMPDLDEGSYLYMPTTMPHASIGEALDVLQYQDKAIAGIPEVASVVGKIGRVDSSLDPAPVSMIETVVNYHPEYRQDEHGRTQTFAFDPETGDFLRGEDGRLIADPEGKPYRMWREHIRSEDDIWEAIVDAADVPGTTSAPKLQPIKARLVMLQSGMRAPMGVKVKGPDLETIEAVGLRIEQFLREVPGVAPSAVYADRIVGKPYLEIDIDREAIARYGLHIRSVQDVVEVAIGGRAITQTVEGRERFAVRVRYARELRDQVESMRRILVPASDGTQIPLEQLATIRYVRGPMAIKSEDTFLVGYVLFDKQEGFAEVDVVESAQTYLSAKIASGEFQIPAGVSYTFAGNYENQLHAQRTLNIVLPLSLALIFVLLYMQFRSAVTTSFVFTGILVAWSGGFLLLWLYGQPWFLDGTVFGHGLRDIFQIHPVNLSVAIWVGFLALFGIASDDGVVIATYLDQSFARNRPTTVDEIRAATLEAGKRRIRPCLMTSATTILALLPVLTSSGRGADIMIPMAIPAFGGMLISLISLFIVPVLYCWREELKLRAMARWNP